MRFLSIKASAMLLVLAGMGDEVGGMGPGPFGSVTSMGGRSLSSSPSVGGGSPRRLSRSVSGDSSVVVGGTSTDALRVAKMKLLREPDQGWERSVAELIAEYNKHITDGTLLKETDAYMLTLYTVLCEISTDRIEYIADNKCKNINDPSQAHENAMRDIDKLLKMAHGHGHASAVSLSPASMSPPLRRSRSGSLSPSRASVVVVDPRAAALQAIEDAMDPSTGFDMKGDGLGLLVRLNALNIPDDDPIHGTRVVAIRSRLAQANRWGVGITARARGAIARNRANVLSSMRKLAEIEGRILTADPATFDISTYEAEIDRVEDYGDSGVANEKARVKSLRPPSPRARSPSPPPPPPMTEEERMIADFTSQAEEAFQRGESTRDFKDYNGIIKAWETSGQGKSAVLTARSQTIERLLAGYVAVRGTKVDELLANTAMTPFERAWEMLAITSDLKSLSSRRDAQTLIGRIGTSLPFNEEGMNGEFGSQFALKLSLSFDAALATARKWILYADTYAKEQKTKDDAYDGFFSAAEQFAKAEVTKTGETIRKRFNAIKPLRDEINKFTSLPQATRDAAAQIISDQIAVLVREELDFDRPVIQRFVAGIEDNTRPHVDVFGDWNKHISELVFMGSVWQSRAAYLDAKIQLAKSMTQGEKTTALSTVEVQNDLKEITGDTGDNEIVKQKRQQYREELDRRLATPPPSPRGPPSPTGAGGTEEAAAAGLTLDEIERINHRNLKPDQIRAIVVPASLVERRDAIAVAAQLKLDEASAKIRDLGVGIADLDLATVRQRIDEIPADDGTNNVAIGQLRTALTERRDVLERNLATLNEAIAKVGGAEELKTKTTAELQGWRGDVDSGIADGLEVGVGTAKTDAIARIDAELQRRERLLEDVRKQSRKSIDKMKDASLKTVEDEVTRISDLMPTGDSGSLKTELDALRVQVSARRNKLTEEAAAVVAPAVDPAESIEAARINGELGQIASGLAGPNPKLMNLLRTAIGIGEIDDARFPEQKRRLDELKVQIQTRATDGITSLDPANFDATKGSLATAKTRLVHNAEYQAFVQSLIDRITGRELEAELVPLETESLDKSLTELNKFKNERVDPFAARIPAGDGFNSVRGKYGRLLQKVDRAILVRPIVVAEKWGVAGATTEIKEDNLDTVKSVLKKAIDVVIPGGDTTGLDERRGRAVDALAKRIYAFEFPNLSAGDFQPFTAVKTTKTKSANMYEDYAKKLIDAKIHWSDDAKVDVSRLSAAIIQYFDLNQYKVTDDNKSVLEGLKHIARKFLADPVRNTANLRPRDDAHTCRLLSEELKQKFTGC